MEAAFASGLRDTFWVSGAMGLAGALVLFVLVRRPAATAAPAAAGAAPAPAGAPAPVPGRTSDAVDRAAGSAAV
ncbi:hypothetical protein ACE1OC_13045 [Streptomyces sp. DSM 116496]|uniref:hypothetical protein n=1 Tax=Streptomyces stoeckheimensis TaxID=3344656 RepID=UPI0038B2D47D